MAEWDAVSEIWFDDEAGFQSMVEKISTGAAREIVEDGDVFLDQARCGTMIVDVTGIPDGTNRKSDLA